MTHQGQYPVVKLSLKGMKMETLDSAMKQFGWMISREFKRHPEILKSDILPSIAKPSETW